jgi:hypothetical protein
MSDTSVQVDGNYSRKMVPKEPSTRALLAAALRDNVLFAALGTVEVEDLINAMEPRSVSAGTVVIQQGDAGDAFYAIEGGRVSGVAHPLTPLRRRLQGARRDLLGCGYAFCWGCQWTGAGIVLAKAFCIRQH